MENVRISIPSTPISPRDDRVENRVENRDGRKTWKSCCLVIDREFTMFFVKYAILIGLLVFFAVELHFATDCSEQQLFMSMLTLIVGLAIPSPGSKH